MITGAGRLSGRLITGVQAVVGSVDHRGPGGRRGRAVVGVGRWAGVASRDGGATLGRPWTTSGRSGDACGVPSGSVAGSFGSPFGDRRRGVTAGGGGTRR